MVNVFIKALIIIVKLIMACIITFYGLTNNIPISIGIVIVICTIKYATYFYQRELRNHTIILDSMHPIISYRKVLPIIDNPVCSNELTIYTIRYINEIIDEYNLGDIVNVNIRLRFPNQPKFRALKHALLYGSSAIYDIRLAYKSESAITLTVFKTWTGYRLQYFHLPVPIFFERHHQEDVCSTLDELKGQIIDMMFIPEEMKLPSPLIKSGNKH